uniref:sugar nucleotide-binding protein n=1 Tax=Nitrospira cf. moscoviensis SBR1015 TaxID=96242 RepID=UPI0011811E0F
MGYDGGLSSKRQGTAPVEHPTGSVSSMERSSERVVMTRRAVITGAAGLIGSYLVRNAARWAPGWEVRGLGRADVDLTDQRAVERAWQVLKPDAVIHCAAMSRTMDCERDPD